MNTLKFAEYPVTEVVFGIVKVTIELPGMERSATSAMRVDERDLLEIKPRRKPANENGIEMELWAIEERRRAEMESRMVDMISRKIAIDLVRRIVNRDD